MYEMRSEINTNKELICKLESNQFFIVLYSVYFVRFVNEREVLLMLLYTVCNRREEK